MNAQAIPQKLFGSRCKVLDQKSYPADWDRDADDESTASK